MPRMGTNGSTMLEPLRQGLPPLNLAAASDAASCALPARYEAVREARHFTRGTLDRWDLGNRFDDVCLVVSELVTNALRHGLPADTPRPAAPDLPVRLHLMRWTGRLVCAVRDPSADEPRHARAGRLLRRVGPGAVPGRVLQRQLGLAPDDRRARRQGGLGPVPAPAPRRPPLSRRLTHRGASGRPRCSACRRLLSRSGPLPGATGAALRPRRAGQPTTRWSNSPSFTPSSMASISARV
ncbi:hypothetical protein GCM10023238_05720 [Streptomyces heliomycini]